MILEAVPVALPGCGAGRTSRTGRHVTTLFFTKCLGAVFGLRVDDLRETRILEKSGSRSGEAQEAL